MRATYGATAVRHAMCRAPRGTNDGVRRRLEHEQRRLTMPTDSDNDGAMGEQNYSAPRDPKKQSALGSGQERRRRSIDRVLS